jgi:hypothetical protein
MLWLTVHAAVLGKSTFKLANDLIEKKIRKNAVKKIMLVFLSFNALKRLSNAMLFNYGFLIKKTILLKKQVFFN